MIKLMLITVEEKIIVEAVNAGIDRIFVDLEINGKLERQGHLDTHITTHKIEDVYKVKQLLKGQKTELLVRINPWDQNSPEEINRVINDGADIVMLPMFKTKKEVELFISAVDGRAKTSLLLETAEALARIDRILEVQGIDEIHVGLNDLHLAMGLDFMFELLSDGIVEYLSSKIRAKNIDFGFGGIARIGEGMVPAELILGEHYRLHSTAVILSREFRNINSTKNDTSLENEIKRIRKTETEINGWTNNDYECNKVKVFKAIKKCVKIEDKIINE